MEPQVVILCGDSKEAAQIRDVVHTKGFIYAIFTNTDAALKFITPTNTCAIIAKAGKTKTDYSLPLMIAAKKKNPKIFCCMFSHTNTENAVLRNTCTESGTNLVTDNFKTLDDAMVIVKEFVSQSGPYACVFCGAGKLGEDQLLRHVFLYHNQLSSSNLTQTCPICNAQVNRFPVHLYNMHGACGRGQHKPEHDLTVHSTFTFTLVVCRRKKDGKFLLVQEVCSWGWWLPGGRINAGEDLMQSAIRETKEEAGIDIKLTGVLRFEYAPSREKDARFRVIFYAEPVDEEQQPKTLPDFESMSAAYIDVEQLQKLPLRSSEPVEWFNYVHRGGTIYPLAILTKEGQSAPR